MQHRYARQCDVCGGEYAANKKAEWGVYRSLCPKCRRAHCIKEHKAFFSKFREEKSIYVRS